VSTNLKPGDRVVDKKSGAEIGTVTSVSYVLQTGRLSLAASEELRRRVKAGENEIKVKAELLLREGRGIRG
jgi:hypothetical protein